MKKRKRGIIQSAERERVRVRVVRWMGHSLGIRGHLEVERTKSLRYIRLDRMSSLRRRRIAGRTVIGCIACLKVSGGHGS